MLASHNLLGHLHPCLLTQGICALQVHTDSRKNSFSAPDEVTLERKGSADSQASIGTDRLMPSSDNALHSDRGTDFTALIRYLKLSVAVAFAGLMAA